MAVPCAHTREVDQEARVEQSAAKSPARPALGSRLSWDELAALRNHALTPDFLAHQLVGASVFPDLPADFEGFERSVEDAVLPATHELYSTAGDAAYRVFYHQRGPDEDYKDHGKAAFKALTAAITALHGKSTGGGNARSWETANREIDLNLYFSPGDPGDPREPRGELGDVPGALGAHHDPGIRLRITDAG